MNRFDAAAARGVQYAGNVQITFGRGRGADRVRFVGSPDVERGAVRVGVNRRRPNAHLAAGTHHAHGNFSAIDNQDFLEHRARPAPPFRLYMREGGRAARYGF